MPEFKSDIGKFISRTKIRVIKEILFFALLTYFFWSDWSKDFPVWLELITLVLFALYIIYGLSYYPKAKAISEKFALYFFDDALGFQDEDVVRKIPYKDLLITKVRKNNNEVIEIRLQTSFGQKIELENLENMGELYKCVKQHIRSKVA